MSNNALALISKIRSEQTSFTKQYSGNSINKTIGKWLSKKTGCETIFYFGEGNNPILSYSNKKSASKFLNPYKSREIQKKIIGDLINNQPKFFVKRSGLNNYNKINNYVKNYYLQVKTMSEWKILKRNSK
jgi:hypothetical protein